MATSVTVYPSSSSYFKNGVLVVDTTVMYAGRTSGGNTYFNFTEFDLTEYAGKSIVSVKLYMQTSDAGNSRTLPSGVGISDTTDYADVVDAVQLNTIATAQIAQGAGQTIEYDISSAWEALSANPVILCMGGVDDALNTYKILGTAKSTEYAPYIVITFNDGIVRYGIGGEWVECEVYYPINGEWTRVVPNYGINGVWREIGTS